MPASGAPALLRPLTGYEPNLRQAASAPEVPRQQRPSGQLSLPLWAPPQQAPPATDYDRDKLAGLLAALVEAYGGSRNIRQLRTALHPDLYQRLAGRPAARTRGYLLKSVHARTPHEGVIEACGVVHSAGRALGMCARLDRGQHGWLCTEFAVMEPRKTRACR